MQLECYQSMKWVVSVAITPADMGRLRGLLSSIQITDKQKEKW